MIDKMIQRRKWKLVNSEEGRTRYRALNNQLRRETDKAKEKWWDEQCTELEEMNKMGTTDLLYRRVRNLTENDRKKKIYTPSIIICDKDSKKLTEIPDICPR